jgi:hypothetical protein
MLPIAVSLSRFKIFSKIAISMASNRVEVKVDYLIDIFIFFSFLTKAANRRPNKVLINLTYSRFPDHSRQVKLLPSIRVSGKKIYRGPNKDNGDG